jgi:hypothetical protein
MASSLGVLVGQQGLWMIEVTHDCILTDLGQRFDEALSSIAPARSQSGLLLFQLRKRFFY